MMRFFILCSCLLSLSSVHSARDYGDEQSTIEEGMISLKVLGAVEKEGFEFPIFQNNQSLWVGFPISDSTVLEDVFSEAAEQDLNLFEIGKISFSDDFFVLSSQNEIYSYDYLDSSQRNWKGWTADPIDLDSGFYGIFASLNQAGLNDPMEQVFIQEGAGFVPPSRLFIPLVMEGHRNVLGAAGGSHFVFDSSLFRGMGLAKIGNIDTQNSEVSFESLFSQIDGVLGGLGSPQEKLHLFMPGTHVFSEGSYEGSPNVGEVFDLFMSEMDGMLGAAGVQGLPEKMKFPRAGHKKERTKRKGALNLQTVGFQSENLAMNAAGIAAAGIAVACLGILVDECSDMERDKARTSREIKQHRENMQRQDRIVQGQDQIVELLKQNTLPPKPSDNPKSPSTPKSPDNPKPSDTPESSGNTPKSPDNPNPSDTPKSPGNTPTKSPDHPKPSDNSPKSPDHPKPSDTPKSPDNAPSFPSSSPDPDDEKTNGDIIEEAAVSQPPREKYSCSTGICRKESIEEIEPRIVYMPPGECKNMLLSPEVQCVEEKDDESPKEDSNIVYMPPGGCETVRLNNGVECIEEEEVSFIHPTEVYAPSMCSQLYVLEGDEECVEKVKVKEGPSITCVNMDFAYTSNSCSFDHWSYERFFNRDYFNTAPSTPLLNSRVLHRDFY